MGQLRHPGILVIGEHPGMPNLGWAERNTTEDGSMNEADMRLASIAYGLPSWPRTANKINYALVAAFALVLTVTQGVSTGAKYAALYLVGRIAIAGLTAVLAQSALRAAIYLGTALSFSLTAFLFVYLYGAA
jgi:hypothetical protein